jgi:outer membrane biosynthesis protein TonB
MKQPKAVRRLSLTDNGLSEFPSDILKLTNLEFLDLEENQIQTLPGEIAALNKLEELYLLENQLQGLPGSFGNLKKLRILGLAYNQLRTFPIEITSLEKLAALDLSDNQLSSLPREIGALKNLRFLVLRNNRITNIPQEFYALRKLEKIYLEGNPIDQKDIELLKATFNKTEIVFQPKSEISSGSATIPSKEDNDNDIYKGGTSELSKLISNNLTYPPDDRSAGLEGKVLFKFKVKDGKLDSLEIINSVGPSIDIEARRVLQLTNGNWSTPSNESFLMPVIFIMDFPGRPENAELMTSRDSYLTKNNYAAALTYCDQLRRRDPFNTDNLTKLIMVYKNLDQMDKAKQVEYLKREVQRLKVATAISGHGQNMELEKTNSGDEIFLVIEDPASFPGGMEKFYDYVSKNIKTPNEVRIRKVSGKVFVEFVIDSTGQIPADQIKVIKGLSKACDEEAVRLVKGSPDWNPGTQRGRPVAQRMVLPITFK